MSEAVYRIDGERIFAGELARGPWNEHAQHGGAPAALIVRALELAAAQIDREGERERSADAQPATGRSADAQPATGRSADAQPALARITYELLRPVPLGELSLTVSLIRPGRRVQLLEASLRDQSGVEVVRARALRVARSEPRTWEQAHSSQADEWMPPAPERAADDTPVLGGVRPMFAHDAIEIRFVEGSWAAPGPATAWFRMRAALVAGETPSPLQRLAAAADFPNGIAAVLDWERFTFINPDLTIYIEREPLGEWICLRANTRIPQHGVALAEAELFDRHGRVGRCCQSLLVTAR